MKEMLTQSTFFGVVLTLLAYETGVFLQKKIRLAIFNPLLVATLIVIGVLLLLDIDYAAYEAGTDFISYCLTPMTVSLAIPLYRRIHLLKRQPIAIFGGIASGVITAMLSIWLLSLLFGLTAEQYTTLLPKSITTAIGMGVSEKLGGIVALTVVSISITGIAGNVLAHTVFKVLKIEDPIAKGVALGTSAHALGTVKAMEMGEVEGAMSSLSIVVTGILTVIAASFFVNLF